MAEDIWYESRDGLKLYAKSYGDPNAPVTALCMHGLTRNHRDFEPMISGLGDGYRFIAVDQRGRGNSAYDPNPASYTLPTYVGDMLTLLDKLGLQKVVLIGTSMGGLMSMVMMKVAPERVRGIVLNDVGPTIERAGLERIAGYVGGSPAVDSWEIAAEATARVQSSAFPDFTPDDWMEFSKRTWKQQDDGKVVLAYDTAISDSLKAVKVRWRDRFLAWRLYSMLKKVPVLIVRGELSDLFSDRTARRMVSRHPDAKLVTVPRVGHAPILDEPAVLPEIKAFLDRFA